MVSDATKAQRHLIQVASLSKKPDTATTQELIKPLQQSLAKVTELKDKNRPSPLFFHLSTVADGIGALGWVVVVSVYGQLLGADVDTHGLMCARY